jgi:hypothetical protein
LELHFAKDFFYSLNAAVEQRPSRSAARVLKRHACNRLLELLVRPHNTVCLDSYDRDAHAMRRGTSGAGPLARLVRRVLRMVRRGLTRFALLERRKEGEYLGIALPLEHRGLLVTHSAEEFCDVKFILLLYALPAQTPERLRSQPQ